ncbi:MAG: hypothetical protein DYG89_39640 [Caldilinea sp. CFX5]|nr:hypothetical protein [Caldilinea sp. CFX5]
MNTQFQRGQQLLTMVIALVLLMEGVSFWLARSLLLTWYHDALAQVHLPDGQQVQRLLGYFVAIDQRHFLTDQGLIYALLILGLIILYLGYSWVRLLWCVVWFTKGVSGLLVAYLLTKAFDLWPNLLVYGLVTSTLYICCALSVLCLPSINLFLRTMRR